MAEDGILYDPSRNPFRLGTKKYLVADEVVGLGRELTPEDRRRISEKYKITRGTLSNVLTALRKEGLYVDGYTRGERTPPSKRRPRPPASGLGGSLERRDEEEYLTRDEFKGFMSDLRADMAQLNQSIENKLMGLRVKPGSTVTPNLPKGLEVKPYLGEPRPQVGDLATQAFQLFETGHTGVEVMQTLDLTYDRVVELLKKFNEMKVEETKRDRMWGDEYVTAWYKIAEHMGMILRDKCEHYRDKSGTCGLWEIDVDPNFRKKFPGLVKTSGRKIRLVVGDHPEICALCKGGASS